MLKVGHHGYFYSTSFYLVKKLMPDIAVFCNEMKGVYPDVKYKLKNISKSKLYATVDSNGIIAWLNGDYVAQPPCNATITRYYTKSLDFNFCFTQGFCFIDFFYI